MCDALLSIDALQSLFAMEKIADHKISDELLRRRETDILFLSVQFDRSNKLQNHICPT